MNSESDKARSLFLSAVENYSPDQWAGFLADACGNDSALRRRVEVLLDAHTGEDSFLDRGDEGGSVQATVAHPIAEQLGAQIGPYRLLQQLGEGGMGVVYLAEQKKPVKRRVALKIIKPGMDTRQVVARFEAERQALAMMDHPNIAKVLDAGATDTGLPYFVMELVQGIPITEYCDRESLTTRERLRIFVDVCSAIQHAHQKGVIHRDLKPSNVLITIHEQRPVAKVIDFGVSKALNQQLTEKTLFTAFGQMIGTPQYMSPEQAEMSGLDIDARCDIYSLGVVLYQLMTGTTPLDAQRLRSLGYAEMQRVICEEEPPRPSTRISSLGEEATAQAEHRRVGTKQLRDQLTGELDWIVMKALEKDRARRYGTANAFALDVERYLKNEPVEACPPSPVYRLSKFAARNRALVGIVASVTILLATVTILNLALAAWATHAKSLAVQRRTRETKARSDAERARKNEAALRATAEGERDKAKEAEEETEKQRVVAQASEKTARAHFQQAKLAVDEYLKTVRESDVLLRPGMSPVRRQLLESASSFYQTLLEGQAATQLDQLDVATARFQLGIVLQELQEPEAAQQQFAEAQPIYAKLLEQSPNASKLKLDLAEIISRRGDPEKAQQICLPMLEQGPDDSDIRRALTKYYRLHAEQLVAADQLEAAMVPFREAEQTHALLTTLESPADTDLGDSSQLHFALAEALFAQKQLESALTRFRQAAAAAERARTADGDKPSHGLMAAISVHRQARVQRIMNRVDDARQNYQVTISLWSKMVFEFPSYANFKAELARLYLELADYESLQGNNNEADRYLFRLEQFVGQLPKKLPSDHYQAAVTLAQLTRPPTGEDPKWSEYVAQQQSEFAMRAVESLSLSVQAGYLHEVPFDQDPLLQPLASRDDFRSLLATQSQQSGKERPGQIDFARLPHQLLMVASLRGIGIAHQTIGQLEAADSTIRRCLEELDQMRANGANDTGAIDAERGKTYYRLGHLHWERRKYRDAYDAWTRAFQLVQEAHDLSTGNARQKLAHAIAAEEWELAEVYGEIAFWDESARHRSNYIQYGRFQNGHAEARRVVITLVSDKAESYDEACRYVMDNFSETNPSQVALHLSVGEQDAVPPDALVKIADRDVSPSGNFIAQTALALAHLQNNDPDAALKNLPIDYAWRIITDFHRARALHMIGDHEAAEFWMQLGDDLYAEIAHRWLASTTLKSPEAFLQGYWSWELAALQASRQRAWEVIRQQSGPDPWAQLFHARGCALIGDVAQSEAAFAKVVEDEPDNPRLWVAMAQVRALVGHQERAEQCFAKALELAPDNPHWWIARGKYYLERGQDVPADADMMHAARLSSDDLDVFLRDGWWAAGPLPHDRRKVFLAAEDAHPSKPVKRETQEAAEKLAPLHWNRIPLDRDDGMVSGRIHLEPVQKTPDQENVSAYALAYVYSPAAHPTTLCIASQYMWGKGKPEREVQLRVWFNNQLVFGWAKPKYANLTDYDRVPVQLQPGRNTILVRVTSPKRIGFRLRLSDGPGERAFYSAASNNWQQTRRALQQVPPYTLVRVSNYWSLYCHALAVTDPAGYDEAVKTTTNYYTHANREHSLGMFLEATTIRPSDALSREVLETALAELKAPKPKWIQRQVGRGLLRAGRFQAAIDWHQKHSLTGIEPECTVAMAHHMLGQEKEANRLLEETKSREFRTLSELTLPLWYAGFVLVREANRLITGQPLDDDPAWQTALNALENAAAGVNPETAEHDLALLLQPRDPRLWTLRAERSAHLGRWADAERDFEKAVTMDRKNIHTWLTVGRYWMRRSNLEKSTEAYSTLLDLDHAGELRPDVLNDLEQNDELYTALLERRKRDMSLCRERGASLCKQKRWRDAAPIWKQMLDFKPNDWNLNRDLAVLHARNGNTSGFAQACQAMLAVESSPPLNAWYASIAADSGIEPNDIVATAQKSCDDDPTNAMARSTLGAALLRAEQYPEALEQLEFAARLSESSESPNRTPEVYMWFLMATAHGKMGNQAKAQRWHGKAQSWLEQNADSRLMSSWLRQITVEILAAQTRQTLDQIANVMD